MTVSTINSHPVGESGQYESFRYEIRDPHTTVATIKIHIPDGKYVKAIPGCMIATSSNIKIEGKVKKSIKAILGPGEARHQHLTAVDGDGWVVLAPSFFGDVRAIPINDDEICIGDNAHIASIGDIDTTAVAQGIKKAFFSGHGMFVKRAKGNGVIFVAAVGSMLTMDLSEEEEVVVDNHHLVTWPRTIKHEIQRASTSIIAGALSGEGMVSRIKGPGTIHIQSRNPQDIALWLRGAVEP